MDKKEIDSKKITHEQSKLFKAATEARDRAYAPYSNYFVGASILDENGNIHQGCNVENGAYTGTHAEAVAIGNMIVNHGKKIKALACVTENKGICCGDCRQRIWEFSGGNKNIPIYILDLKGEGNIYTIGDLLPEAFELE